MQINKILYLFKKRTFMSRVAEYGPFKFCREKSTSNNSDVHVYFKRDIPKSRVVEYRPLMFYRNNPISRS